MPLKFNFSSVHFYRNENQLTLMYVHIFHFILEYALSAEYTGNIEQICSYLCLFQVVYCQYSSATTILNHCTMYAYIGEVKHERKSL